MTDRGRADVARTPRGAAGSTRARTAAVLAGRAADGRAARGRAHQRQLQGDDTASAPRSSGCPAATATCSPSTATRSTPTRCARPRAAPRRPSLDYLPDHQALVVEWVEGRTLTARRPARRRQPGAGGRRRAGLLHAGPAVRRRLRHVRHAAPLPAASSRSAASGCPTATWSCCPAGGPHRRGARRTSASRPCRATTTCSPPTSSTTATGSGSSTTSTAATTTRASSSATSGASRPARLDHLEVLVDSYYGGHLRHKVARARLLGLMSKYGWTLWASIQDVGQPDRLRLLVLGHGEVRPRGRRVRRPGLRPAARRGRAGPTEPRPGGLGSTVQVTSSKASTTAGSMCASAR